MELAERKHTSLFGYERVHASLGEAWGDCVDGVECFVDVSEGHKIDWGILWMFVKSWRIKYIGVVDGK